jgi:hypothetical protein
VRNVDGQNCKDLKDPTQKRFRGRVVKFLASGFQATIWAFTMAMAPLLRGVTPFSASDFVATIPRCRPVNRVGMGWDKLHWFRRFGRNTAAPSRTDFPPE